MKTITRIKPVRCRNRNDPHQLRLTVEQQQKEIQMLPAGLKEQADQIQKVSARFEVSTAVRQWAAGN
jgi:hypothetical protein